MIGEGEESSFRFDDLCFFELGVLFVLTCASLFIALFCLEGQGGVSEVGGSVGGGLRLLDKPGGVNNMHSVFEGLFPVPMCI